MNALILAVAVAALFFLAVGSGMEILFRLAYLALGTLVVAFLWSRLSLHGVTLERRAPSLRSQVGDELSEHLTLTNRSLLPKTWITVQD